MGKRKRKRTKGTRVDLASIWQQREEEKKENVRLLLAEDKLEKKNQIQDIWDLYNQLREDAGNNHYQPMMELVHQYYQYTCPTSTCQKLTEFKNKNFVYIQACHEQYCKYSPWQRDGLPYEDSPFHPNVVYSWFADEGARVYWAEIDHCGCARCRKSRRREERARARWRQNHEHYGDDSDDGECEGCIRNPGRCAACD